MKQSGSTKGGGGKAKGVCHLYSKGVLSRGVKCPFLHSDEEPEDDNATMNMALQVLQEAYGGMVMVAARSEMPLEEGIHFVEPGPSLVRRNPK